MANSAVLATCVRSLLCLAAGNTSAGKSHCFLAAALGSAFTVERADSFFWDSSGKYLIKRL